MKDAVITRLRAELQGLREQGLYKPERVLEGPQGGVVEVAGRAVINLCANNYLGLANHPAVRAAAQRSLDESGYGMASVRFICGTQQTHKQLERRLAALPRHGGRDPLLLVLRRQRRALRDAAR